MTVIAAVASIRSSPPANRTIPQRACSTRSSQPAEPSSLPAAGLPLMFSKSPAAPSESLASGRFQGSLPGILERVTSIVSAPPSATPVTPLGSKYSRPSRARATALRPPASKRASRIAPAGEIPSSSILASTIPPSSISAWRVSPIPRSVTHSGNWISCRFQKDTDFGERQADDVGIAAGDMADIDFAISLQRITAGLAAPFSMAGVKVDLLGREMLRRDHRLDQSLPEAFPWNRERYARQHPVPPAREEAHAGPQRVFIFHLGEDAPPDRDDRIRGKDERFRLLRRNRLRLLERQPQRMLPRELAIRHALVHIRGHDRVRSHSDAGEQVEAARARRGEDQAHQ